VLRLIVQQSHNKSTIIHNNRNEWSLSFRPSTPVHRSSYRSRSRFTLYRWKTRCTFYVGADLLHVVLLAGNLMTARLMYQNWRTCGMHTLVVWRYCTANLCVPCVLCDDFQSPIVRTFSSTL